MKWQRIFNVSKRLLRFRKEGQLGLFACWPNTNFLKNKFELFFYFWLCHLIINLMFHFKYVESIVNFEKSLELNAMQVIYCLFTFFLTCYKSFWFIVWRMVHAWQCSFSLRKMGNCRQSFQVLYKPRSWGKYLCEPNLV